MRVTEIFYSIQGESSFAGRPCLFVRLTWCNLRCTWCDSEYTFRGGIEISIDEVIAKLSEYPCRLVEITGGEPLVQKEACLELVRRLCDLGYEVLIETSGSLDIRPLDARSIRIVDVKCPGSGEADRTYWENLIHLGPRDEVKFVIRDRADFEYACQVITTYQLHQREPAVLFSPVWGEVDLRQFAGWVLEAEERGVHGRMQLQLHKYIWGPDAKGV